MTFGENLKKARKNKGFTQKDLAEIVGIKRSTIAGYESKDQEPAYKVLKKIAKALDCSIDTLLAVDYDNYKVSESNVTKEILHNDQLKLLFNEIREMSNDKIEFYRNLIKFIESEKNE
ncbi:helix-turn-helix protein [Halanaerobium saccharolyticum]|uniref:Helix-turn-helix protein n=1 Tax=Halanaerobium saccharolyticum TaxID=43595 RepID=A0A4R7Z7E6_9FIRM|nr:helix-turn-helix transcriptional regulator [Halanaerobium saccharolyticum]RAK12491.1 helix-turn-helix protein [Halanaerobium saccharolyticum]TDW06417.1 helix-turn-helix protein [Halanaerobium saccharolyticum]TDX61665.1 helix-turn-helix protein [Halanaerobium saccharolyticum]